MKLISHLVSKVKKVCWQNGGQGPITLVLCPLLNLPFLKIFITDFSGTMKARKLKVCINMDNNWMSSVYRNRGQGSITVGVISLGRFSKNLNAFR